MTKPGFIEAGLGAIREALQAAADRAGLTLGHYPVTRGAARRFRARLRLLETLLRRLIVLMALQTPLPHPEPVEGPAKAGTSGGQSDAEAKPNPRSRPPHPKLPAPAKAGVKGFAPFRLTPQPGHDAARLEALRARPRSAAPRHPHDTVTAPLRHRYDTLLHHLETVDRIARRMARHLARLRAAGAPKPVVPATPGTARLGHELGLVASLLPAAVSTALDGWYDTG